MAKARPNRNPFHRFLAHCLDVGLEDDYLNEEVQAFIEFNAGNGGSFQFGYVQGQIDYRATNRDGKPAVEFSWEGGDGADGTALTGRGWAILGDGD